jgi:hypothetical protein
MIIRSPRLRPGQFFIGGAKRLLQHYPIRSGQWAATFNTARSPRGAGLRGSFTAPENVELRKTHAIVKSYPDLMNFEPTQVGGNDALDVNNDSYGGAKLTDKHLASTVHCIDDEIIGWLKRREQRRLACSWQSAYKYLP